MSSYTDWQGILKYIPNTPSKTILELGCGAGTKILLENFNKVISWECSIEEKRKWWESCLEQFEDNPKWEGYYQLMNHWKGVSEINQIILETRGNTRTLNGIDGSGINDYWSDLVNTVDLSKIDVAFVDQGFHQRGETVLRFFEANIPYVFWHDAGSSKQQKIYGYNLINDNLKTYGYKQRYKLTRGQGTVLAELIK